MYQFVDDTLYRRRPNGVKLKCVCREDGKELLAKIHRGMCGSHIGRDTSDQDEAEKVARRANMYQFVDDTLYRRRPNGVKLKWVCWEEGNELLAEIHKGMCGSHIGSRALVGKAFLQGFY